LLISWLDLASRTGAPSRQTDHIRQAGRSGPVK